MEQKRSPRGRFHVLALCLIIAVVAGASAYMFLHVNFIPAPASAERGLIDGFIQLLFAIGGIIFVSVVLVVGYALLFFRRRRGDETDAGPSRDNIPIELAWTIIPFIIVTLLSFHGASVLDRMGASAHSLHGGDSAQSVYSLGAFVPGPAATENTTETEMLVNVTASRFFFEFAYPEYSINATYELVVPVDRRILFKFESRDVIHSFWVQEWGPKMDAVPGLSPVLRITPTELGEFTVECSQLCGFGHTAMTAPVRVVSTGAFETWVQEQQTAANVVPPPPESHALVELLARDLAFDKSTITVPAGVHLHIEFENGDVGVPHNFAVYRTAAGVEPIFVGEIITGPQRITYMLETPDEPGEYFFRCDVHPQMTGTFIVK